MMKARDIVIGVIILLVAILIVIYLRREKTQETINIPASQSTVEENLEDIFQRDIPDNAEKAELEDKTGANLSAIATRIYENGKFTLTVLADLPDTTDYYQAWLENSDGKLVSLGELMVAKGGFVIDYVSDVDYGDYSKVIISREKILDLTPEEIILEGQF